MDTLARLFAEACDVAADVIFVMKRKAEIELGAMAASLGISAGLAIATGGLSALIGAAETAAMRQTIKRIIDEAADRVVDELIARVSEPATAKLEAMVENAVLDLTEGAFSMPAESGGGAAGSGPASGGGDERGGRHGMMLASAGGGTGAAGNDLFIDHAEVEDGARRLSLRSGDLHNESSAPLSRARGAFGRSRGRDPFTQAFDSILHGALTGSEKALGKVAKHVAETFPERVTATSRLHKGIDLDVRDRIDSILAGDRPGAGSGSPRGGTPSGRRDGMGLTPSELSQKARDLAKKELCGDPIDMAGGQMVYAQTDLDLPGALPLTLRRTHLSGYNAGMLFGPSWASTLDERLEHDEERGGVWWYREDGSMVRLPPPSGPGRRPCAAA